MKLLDTRQLFPQEPLSRPCGRSTRRCWRGLRADPPVPSPSAGCACRPRHPGRHPLAGQGARARWCCCAWPSQHGAGFSRPCLCLGGQTHAENGLWTQARASPACARWASRDAPGAPAGLQRRHGCPRQRLATCATTTRATGAGRAVLTTAPHRAPASAHVLVQLRCATPEAAAAAGCHCGPLGRQHRPRPMAGNPLRTNPGRAENFGYSDGISQPWRTPRRASRSGPTKVPRGDCCWATTLRDKQYPCPRRPTPCADNGTILVVRKLRQWTGRWPARSRTSRPPGTGPRSSTPSSWAASATANRWPSHRPLCNDFNFRADATAGAHPRTSPRQPAPVQQRHGLTNVMPRIMRAA